MSWYRFIQLNLWFHIVLSQLNSRSAMKKRSFWCLRQQIVLNSWHNLFLDGSLFPSKFDDSLFTIWILNDCMLNFFWVKVIPFTLTLLLLKGIFFLDLLVNNFFIRWQFLIIYVDFCISILKLLSWNLKDRFCETLKGSLISNVIQFLKDFLFHSFEAFFFWGGRLGKFVL